MKITLTAASAVVVSTLAALVLTGPAGAVDAAVPPRPHPPITDVAGDAPTPLGTKVPAADVRSADITLDGRTLTVTVRTGASAAAGSGPSNNIDRAPYMLLGVFSNPNGQAIPVRIFLNPGSRGVLALSDETSFEGATSSMNGVTRVSFSVPRDASTYLSQGITMRTAAKGFAAFGDVRTPLGRAQDRSDNYDFTLGG